jgi:hypothetical protein
VGKEELPLGGVVKLTPVVTSDTLDLVVKLSTDKREEWVVVKKSVRLQA